MLINSFSYYSLKNKIKSFLIYFFISSILPYNDSRMIALNIKTSSLPSLFPLMIANKDYIKQFVQNLRYSKKLILLLNVFSGLMILQIGGFIENNFPVLIFSIFLILFLIYLFIRIYNNSEKKVKAC